MRTALLQSVKRTETGDLRAEMTLGGRSVLAWQVDLARAMGVQRIVCLCETPGAQVLALQRDVENSGGEFHAIRSNLQLASLVRADDELVMLLDGLVVDQTKALEFAFSDDALRKGIATIPADHALAEAHSDDFERIDRDRHWAGFAAMRAGQVHKLADMPPDGDAMSLLLRLALQSRVECRDLSGESLASRRWMLADSSSALAERELALVEAGAEVSSWMGPGRAAASLIVRKITPRWIESGADVSALAAAALLLGGLLLAGFGFGSTGLTVAALGALGGALSEAWSGLKRRLWSQKRVGWLHSVIPIGVDIAAATALLLVYGFDENPVVQIALPILAIGLAHHLGKGTGGKALAFWQDRALHLAFFAVAAATGFLGEALSVFALAALAHLIFRRETS